MRLRLLPLLVLVFLTFNASAQKYLEMIDAGTFTLAEIQQEAEAYFDIVGRGKGTGHKQYKRWEYVAQMELDDSGIKIPNYELSKRARDYRKAAKQQETESSNFGGDWKQLGPTYHNATSGWNPGVGRVTSIGIDESNTNHIIVGSPTGGVWKTLDGGNTWVNLTDNYSTVDVYALEISPYNSNHYLWGSTSGRIFRSTDAGATWVSTGNVTGTGRVSRIQYHPTSSNTVYAVSESNGLFRSTNGGNTWGAVSGVSGVVGYDVEFKPGDPNTIYFSGRSVYRSTNGGTSFTQINGFGTANNNYKMMGVSPANPNFVYVLESNGGRFGAFYKSTNSGGSFNKLIDGADINFFGYSATGDDDRGQAPRDMDVAVNPFNANEVHIAGIHTWKSTNGGTSFNLTSHWVPSTAASLGVGYNHADIDILKFIGNTLYVGSDGGIYKSTNGAASFIDLTPGLGIREFYKIGVSKTNPNVVSGGSQDNGTSVMRGDNRLWVDWLGADGMETFVDWNNANILYGTSQYGSMYRSTNQGNSRSSISKPPDVGDGAWVTPFEQDPQVPATIYVAFADVWKSTNSGSGWTKISDFDNGNMNQMKLAPSNNQRIYVARGSNLFTTANGGTTWVTTPKTWGTASISFIAVHPQNPERLLIVTSSSVYHSTNAGNNWTTISTGLPSGTKYCAAWENTGKNGIYVGGFGFVSYTNDDLNGQWVGFFDGLPNVRVYELEINYVSNTIFAGTYGRGLWESPLYQLAPPISAFTADKRQGCQEVTVNFTDKSTNGPTTWEWTFEGGTPATSTERNPTVTFSGGGPFNVRLKTANSAGDNTAEELDYITLLSPPAPVVPDQVRCDPGNVSFVALNHSGDNLKWYDSELSPVPLFVGDVFTTDLVQTTTYYVSSTKEFLMNQHVGPADKSIGDGADHAGNFYLILDAEKPFLLKSALFYSRDAKNRTFQLRDANQNVLLEKTIFVGEGEVRVALDMDIPQGTDLQLGCLSPANLFRNSAGVSYPYTIDGLMQIKSSTAGPDYYYYFYDIEVEHLDVCESARVPVTAEINSAPEAATLTALSSTTLCPNETVELVADNVCIGCTVSWSNGETGPSIIVAVEGDYSATVINSINNGCGDSPESNVIAISAEPLPTVPSLLVSGPTEFCPGGSVLISVESVCAGCTVSWSNGETEPGITVVSEGVFTAVFQNHCGESPLSDPVSVAINISPEAPVVVASGDTEFCEGASVLLLAENVCSGCTVHWSNGETGPSITVSAAGEYTAIVTNANSSDCSDSPASSPVSILVKNMPDAPSLVTSDPTTLCPGESLQISADLDCADCTVNWSNGEAGSSIMVTTAGSYTATAVNSCGVSAVSEPVAVETRALPDVPLISTTDPTTLCPGESLQISADNACADCTINWSNGATGSSIMVTTAGSYTATSTNLCGESAASEAIAVETLALPEVPAISSTDPTTLCPGESLQISADLSCSDCTINWSNGATGSSISVNTAGIYTATSSNLCGESAASEVIVVETATLPEVPAIFTTDPTTLCAGESLQLSAGINCSDCIINWSNGETDPVISVSVSGSYTATSSNQCGESAASEAIEVLVYPVFEPTVVVNDTCYLAAPEGSGYQWYLDGVEIPDATEQTWTAQVPGLYVVTMNSPEGCPGRSVSIFAAACLSSRTHQVLGQVSALLYPNPAQDRVFLDIQVLRKTSAQLELYSADGRLISRLFKGDILPGGQLLDIKLPDLPSGMYQYRLVTDMGTLSGSLVVQQR